MLHEGEKSPVKSRPMTDDEFVAISNKSEYLQPVGIFEQYIYALLREWTDGVYQGGEWQYHLLPNGAWYLAPDPTFLHPTYPVNDANGSYVVMSADAAGLAATIYHVHRTAWELDTKEDTVGCARAVAHWRSLMAYAHQHLEATAILRVLD